MAFSSLNGLRFLAAAEDWRWGSICEARLVDSSITALSELFLFVRRFAEGGSEKGPWSLIGVSSSMTVVATESRSLPVTAVLSCRSTSGPGLSSSAIVVVAKVEDDDDDLDGDALISTVLGPLPTRTTCGLTEVAVDALAFLRKVDPMLKAGEGGGLSYFSKLTDGTGGAESSLLVLAARDLTLTIDGLRKLPF
jgi:hypothetical protein